MSRKLDKASVVTTAALMMFALFSAETGASAESRSGHSSQPPLLTEPAVQFIAEPVVQALPVIEEPAPATETAPVSATSLAALVEAQPQPDGLSRELNCLAGAVYFESRSEPLAGQLAVGRVIVARSKSGRFPASYCGVVFQPSQFSFVRGGAMPAIARNSRDWHEAVAIAQIAHAGSWQSPVEGAISFHAARVSPGWRLKRLAQVGNHVFYR